MRRIKKLPTKCGWRWFACGISKTVWTPSKIFKEPGSGRLLYKVFGSTWCTAVSSSSPSDWGSEIKK